MLNSGIIKLLLLSQGVSIDSKTLYLISQDSAIQENRYYYNVSNDVDLCLKLRIPSEIILPDDVVSSIYLNKSSNLSIKQKDKEFGVYLGNKFISKIKFNQKPLFFGKLLKDGSVCEKYCSMYGQYVLGLFIDNNCIYANTGYACKFCSIKPTRKIIGNQNAAVIHNQNLEEVLQLIKDDQSRIKYVMYTAGTYSNLDTGIEIQAKTIQKTVKILGNEKIGHHLTTMPPKDYKKLQLLKDSGLTSIAYDLEVYDPVLFKSICPGKNKFFGYLNLINSYEYALDTFGKNNVKVGFVGGLEPISTLSEGMEFFGKKGISIAINVFHPDPNTSLEKKPRPSVEYLLEMVKIQRDIYRHYGLIPVFPIGGRRSSLDTEVYRGFFDNCEQLDLNKIQNGF